jgi:chaperonin GroEL
MVVKKGMAKATDAAVAEIKKQSKSPDGSKDIARVAPSPPATSSSAS